MLVEEPKPFKKQAQIEQDKAYAKELEAELNKNINWDDVIEQKISVYADDIIFGSTNKDLCKAFEKLMKDKFQISSMGKLTFFLGVQVNQKPYGIFISQYKYVAKILRKFGLTDRKSASTPIDNEKPLLKDPDVCACARFQVTPKASHLHAVKRIFRYLKVKPHLGLSFGVDAVEDFKEYTLRDYYCWLKTYCYWYKLKLLDNAVDSRLRLLEESAAANEKIKK
nr:hypothetical protein [Tanacetum cinerariifolium]